ncbi:MAG TPA: YIP1 family protein [Bacteroidota bacterium]
MSEDESHLSNKPTALIGRLLGVYFRPGHVFEEVAGSKTNIMNWLTPVVILVLLSMVLLQIAFQDTSLRLQLTEMLGTLGTQQQEIIAEGADGMSPPSVVIFVMGQIGGFVVLFALALLFVAGLSLLYWLVGRSAMNARAPYMKVTEVVSLSLMVFIVEFVVTVFLIISFHSLHASPSAALFLHDFDFSNKYHIALARLNPFTIWYLAVLSLGLSKLFNRDYPKVFVLVVALWLLWSLVTLLGESSF